MSEKKFIVVYQFGKVGSTSIVASLNKIDGVQAHQCHFLGEQAYASIIKSMLYGEANDYFFEHTMGQLVNNVGVERAMLAGEKIGVRSYILSLSRNPVDWFRSAVLQDLSGTIAGIQAFADDRGQGERPLAHAIDVLREEIKQLFRLSVAGNDHARRPAQLIGQQASRLEQDYGDFAGFVIQQLRIFIRPFFWFEDQFEAFTEQKVVLDSNNEYHASDEKRTYMVMRFEDLAKLPELLRDRWGMPLQQLESANVSAAKPGADRVKQLFKGWSSDKELVELLGATTYCRDFGYFKVE